MLEQISKKYGAASQTTRTKNLEADSGQQNSSVVDNANDGSLALASIDYSVNPPPVEPMTKDHADYAVVKPLAEMDGDEFAKVQVHQAKHIEVWIHTETLEVWLVGTGQLPKDSMTISNLSSMFGVGPGAWAGPNKNFK